MITILYRHSIRHSLFGTYTSRHNSIGKRTMTSVILPPKNVKGMQNLDRNSFNKTISVPNLMIEKTNLPEALAVLKKYIFKLENFKAIQSYDEKYIMAYLHPDTIKSWNHITLNDLEILQSLGLTEKNFEMKELTLTYENFSHETILKSVLPDESDGFSSFTKVGHIIQVNLRDHLIPYKKLIGEVLLEKIKSCRTVVNKINIIDNTYRNFHMELLSGEDMTQTCVKENSCIFEFDFSTVYWNSRLCTEHERIIKKTNKDDIFIDIFAGVGPFSIPIAKKKCHVYANDLNPESIKWLNHNIKLNKLDKGNIETFNKDGRDFITTEVKEIISKNLNRTKIHICMNLPALAVEFLSSFIGLFEDSQSKIIISPIIYIYCFAKGSESNTNYKEIAKSLVNQSVNENIEDKIIEIFEVRTVSNFKKMMRISIKLDEDILSKCKKSVTSKRKIEDGNDEKTKCLKSDNGKEENSEGV